MSREEFDPGTRVVGRRCVCGLRLELVGVVHVRAIKGTCTLLQCRRCDVLIAVHCGEILWQVDVPSPNPNPSPKGPDHGHEQGVPEEVPFRQ
jgi:hypothetical protein